MEVIKSHAVIALTQELRMITAGTSYTICAIIMLHAMPAATLPGFSQQQLLG